MIWILLGYLLFGGSGIGALQQALERTSDAIEEHVGEEARRDRALAAIEAFDERLDDEIDRFHALENDFFELLRDRGSSPSDFESQFKASDALRMGVQNGLLDLREKLRGELQKSEWRQVFPGPG